MSKFDYDVFYGGIDYLAVSKEKYTKEEAIEIAKRELCHKNPKYLAIGEGFARYRFGRNEDGEPCSGWWIEYKQHKRSCPCWTFHATNNQNEKFYKDYKYIPLI